MKRIVPGGLVGAAAVLLLVTNTLFWSIVFFPITFIKVILPFRATRVFFSKVLDTVANWWIAGNNAGLAMTRTIRWHVEGLESLRKDRWYLVISNHQSWTDIVVLQKVFFRKIPFLKFFLKKELIWVPILGMAWWALDFPFMKRYSRELLEKKPHLKGTDIEITRRACAKFKHIPVSIMNFVEGTRFTPEKNGRQASPFSNLLKPKSGGIGFIFTTMGDQLTSVLDVTIAYPGGPYTFWDFLCGRVIDIRLNITEIPVTQELLGDYVNDTAYQERFQAWLNSRWEEKAKTLDRLLAGEFRHGAQQANRINQPVVKGTALRPVN